MIMKLIPQWKKWWKRHSVQIIAIMPAISIAREQLPGIREYLPPDVYGFAMVVLGIAAIIVMQIKQSAVSGGQQ